MDTKEAGKRGGIARTKKLAPAQRSAIAKKAVEARIKKLKQKQHDNK